MMRSRELVMLIATRYIQTIMVIVKDDFVETPMHVGIQT